MKLFNKIILTDLVLALAIVSLFFLPSGSLRDGVLGAAVAVFIIAIANHVTHYRTFKKFY